MVDRAYRNPAGALAVLLLGAVLSPPHVEAATCTKLQACATDTIAAAHEAVSDACNCTGAKQRWKSCAKKEFQTFKRSNGLTGKCATPLKRAVLQSACGISSKAICVSKTGRCRMQKVEKCVPMGAFSSCAQACMAGLSTPTTSTTLTAVTTTTLPADALGMLARSYYLHVISKGERAALQKNRGDEPYLGLGRACSVFGKIGSTTVTQIGDRTMRKVGGSLDSGEGVWLTYDQVGEAHFLPGPVVDSFEQGSADGAFLCMFIVSEFEEDRSGGKDGHQRVFDAILTRVDQVMRSRVERGTWSRDGVAAALTGIAQDLKGGEVRYAQVVAKAVGTVEAATQIVDAITKVVGLLRAVFGKNPDDYIGSNAFIMVGATPRHFAEVNDGRLGRCDTNYGPICPVGEYLRSLRLSSNGTTHELRISVERQGSIHLGDADADGNPDLVTVANDGRVLVRHGDGTGAFGAPALWDERFGKGPQTGWDGPVVGLSNVDGVGGADLVRYVRKDGGEVQVATSTAAGFAPVLPWLTFPSTRSAKLVIADVTHDGRADAIVFTENVYVAPSTGSMFGTPKVWYSGFSPSEGVRLAGHFDADDEVDVVAVPRGDDGRVFVGLNDGKATFRKSGSGAWATSFGKGSPVVLAGDFDGDGLDDLAAVNVDFFGSGPSAVTVITSTGKTFSRPVEWAPAVPKTKEVLAADVDKDGKADLVFVGPGGQHGVVVWRSTGDGFAAIE